MKLTKREKKLIIILIILVASIGYYRFVLQPPLNKLKILNETKVEKTLKAEQLRSQLKLKEKVYDEYKILGYKINNISSKYFSEINQENIIIVLDKIIKESGLRESSITFSDISIKDITEKEEIENQETFLHQLARKIEKEDMPENKKENEEDKSSSQNDTVKNSQVEGMTVIINYEGSYNQLLRFLFLIEQNEDKIVINMLNAVVNEGILQGSIVLEFNTIPNVINDDEVDEWDLYDTYGKDNPFSIISDLSGSNIREERLVQAQSDFVMIVKPLSSDAPALTLGKNKDRAGETNIYADNDRIEDINIYFLERDGKLYYKYKSEKYSYPKNFNEWVEFTPYSDNINIRVYSEKRNSLEDVSGVNMIINNDTNYKVVVTVVNDDIERSRVRVQKEKGKIEVVNN